MLRPASGQDPTDALQRVIAADAERLLKDADPTVRGEAALVLAGTGDRAWHEEILAVAKDEQEQARLRGLVALGMLGAPGAERVLARVLDDNTSRVKSEGLAAALGLGLLAPDAAPSEVTRVLTRFLQSNYKRQRDLIAVMLAALAGGDQAPQRQALLRLLDDTANRDLQLRTLLIEVLGRVPDTLDATRCAQILARGSNEERAALLAVLAVHQHVGEAELVPELARLVAGGGSPEIRAQALAVLTRMRHLPALEMAGRALGSNEPAEVAQGTASALHLGGTSMRGPLEKHITAATVPALQAAMLRAFSGPLTDAFAETCVALAGGRKNPVALRAAAALALAQADDVRCVPGLRDAFLETDDQELLEQLARAILRIEKAPPQLQRLHRGPRPEDLAAEPRRLVALLAAGHPQAQRFVLTSLERPTATAQERAELLRAWRLGCQFALPPARAAVLPAPLRPLFP